VEPEDGNDRVNHGGGEIVAARDVRQLVSEYSVELGGSECSGEAVREQDRGPEPPAGAGSVVG
jgi:hypothetical protein